MAFMWVLMGIVLVAVICTAREVIKGWNEETQKSVIAVGLPRQPAADEGHLGTTRKHRAKWLSMKDCETLLRMSDKVFFVAIRAGSREGPLPFQGLDAISIQPDQLADVLRWLPRDKKVVLCGEVDLCWSVIGPPDGVGGAAPIYVLRSEAAQRRAG